MSGINRIVNLATTSRERLQLAAELQTQLSQQLSAQKIILDDLSESLPNIQNLTTSIAATDQILAPLNRMLDQSTSFLVNALAPSANSNTSSEAEVTIKFLLTMLQTTLSDICLAVLGNGETQVSVLQLIDLEEEIRKIVEDLRHKNMFPEAADESQARMAEMQAHMDRVLAFLEEISGESAA
jgi:hypothetical protein